MSGKNRTEPNSTEIVEVKKLRFERGCSNVGMQIGRDGSKSLTIIPSDKFTGKKTRLSQPIWP